MTDDENIILLDGDYRYINASWVGGLECEFEYIATQAPLQHTIDDFWWLVWQKEIRKIAMIATEDEFGPRRLPKYWPAYGEQQTYGTLNVLNARSEDYSSMGFTIREFEVTFVSLSYFPRMILYISAHEISLFFFFIIDLSLLS